jgi:signal transduction histidine kinase
MAQCNHSVGCGRCDELAAREQATRAAAEAVERRTDEFLLTFSHDLRGRLNAITGWASVLRGRIAGDELSERAIETIERNAWAQARLIDEMLARLRHRASTTTARGDQVPHDNPVPLAARAPRRIARVAPRASRSGRS